MEVPLVLSALGVGAAPLSDAAASLARAAPAQAAPASSPVPVPAGCSKACAALCKVAPTVTAADLPVVLASFGIAASPEAFQEACAVLKVHEPRVHDTVAALTPSLLVAVRPALPAVRHRAPAPDIDAPPSARGPPLPVDDTAHDTAHDTDAAVVARELPEPGDDDAVMGAVSIGAVAAAVQYTPLQREAAPGHGMTDKEISAMVSRHVAPVPRSRPNAPWQPIQVESATRIPAPDVPSVRVPV